MANKKKGGNKKRNGVKNKHQRAKYSSHSLIESKNKLRKKAKEEIVQAKVAYARVLASSGGKHRHLWMYIGEHGCREQECAICPAKRTKPNPK